MRRRVARKVLVACVALLAALVFPFAAHAAQPAYSIDKLDTELYVETDASIHVIHRQHITFSRASEGLVWYLHEPEKRESVKMSSVRAVPIDAQGNMVGEWVDLQLVDSNVETQGRRPGDAADASERAPGVQPWYSYSISDGFMRAYFPAESGSYLVETDYVVANRVRVFRDVGELYWRYAHSDMPVDAHDVALRIALPLPAGEVALAGESVIAWGHGPTEGEFAIGEDGSVAYHLDVVGAGHYAECHVLFPVSWLPNVSSSSPQYRTELRRTAAIAEESEWLDASARASIWDNQVRGMFGVVGVAFLVAAVVLVAVRGRTGKTRRGLVRLAVTLLVVALAEQFFFKEPITTALLLAIAAILALGCMYLIGEEEAGRDEAGSDGEGACDERAG